MKNRATYIFILLLVFFGSWAAGASKAYKVQEIPNTRLSDAGSYVSNPDGILTASTVSQVNEILGGLYRNSGIETAVVVVGSIDSDSPEEFAVDLFRSWGIGQKGKDNGLLILLVTEDRFVRFEVGYGLEGDLPDAIAKRIQTVRMMPYLREGDWNNAVLEGVRAVDEYLNNPDSELRNDQAYASQGTGDIITRLIFIFGGMIGIILIALFAQRRARRCPRCKSVMKVTGSRETRISNNIRMVSTTFVCPKCGYTTTKNTRHHLQQGGTIGGGFGGFPGGMGGGSGGFGGGSWGGGRSGGGGATTRF